MPQEWFAEWFNTPYYHRLYNKRDEAEAASFINKLIGYLQPEAGARMLDVACGKGRHSWQLAEKGYDVTGIDISPDSIHEAEKMGSPNLRFYVHDMRLPFHINYYNYAFNFFTSFGYFRTRREHDNAIRSIAQSVKSGGTFVLDYLNAAYSNAHLVPTEKKVIETTTYDIERWTDGLHFYKKIIVQDPALQAPMQYTEKVARFTCEDFKQMFEKQGLKIEEIFGDYHFNQWDEMNSPRLIIIATKG